MNQLKVKLYKIKSGEHVVCFIDPVSNKRRRKKFKAKYEAKVYQKDLELRFNTKGPQSFNQTPVGQLMKLHLEKFPNSRVLERKVHFLSFCKEFGDRPMSQVGKDEMSMWFQKIKQQHDLSDRTLNTIKSNMNSFFHDLEDKNVIVASPMSKIRFERKPLPRRQRVVLSVDEVHRILENVKNI